MERHELADEQWEQLVECLPPLNTGRGCKMHDRRRTINGVLWILKTGAPWRDLPEKFGKWNSIYVRFRLWQQDGTWDRIFHALLLKHNVDGEIDWSLFCIDGSIVRAHKAAAGALKKSRT